MFWLERSEDDHEFLQTKPRVSRSTQKTMFPLPFTLNGIRHKMKHLSRKELDILPEFLLALIEEIVRVRFPALGTAIW